MWVHIYFTLHFRILKHFHLEIPLVGGYSMPIPLIFDYFVSFRNEFNMNPLTLFRILQFVSTCTDVTSHPDNICENLVYKQNKKEFKKKVRYSCSKPLLLLI